jgi:Glyoxalase-like domain
VAAGATLKRSPDGEIHWWVLADPEGNEFCAFPPREGTTAGIYELVVAAADPLAQARWWSMVIGGEVGEHAGGAYLEGAAGLPWQYWVFDRITWPKQVKNRLHWDVLLAGPDPEPLLAAGARMLRPKGGDIDWWILADPEGNEFCAFFKQNRDSSSGFPS